MQPSHSKKTLETVALPVVEERLRFSRSIEETGPVCVRTESEQSDEHLELERFDETAEVERVPFNRMAGERRGPWMQGDVLVVPAYREVAVVERRLMLVEQLHTRRRSTRLLVQRVVPGGRQRAVVERRSADGSWAEPGFSVDPSTQTGEQ